MPLMSPEAQIDGTGDRGAIIADLDDDFGRARSHQLDPLVPGGDMPLRGSGSMEGTQMVQIPIGHQVGQPPKTANEAQNPRQGRVQNRGAPR